MSSRSVGYGICPRCGNRGVLIIKELNGGYYAYYRHGRTWHYIGPLPVVYEQVINSLDSEYRESLRRAITQVSAFHGIITINKHVVSKLINGIINIRNGILWFVILNALFYITAIISIHSEIISIADIVKVINALVSLTLTYAFLLNGFNTLSDVDNVKYGIGLGGTYLRMIGLSIVIVANVGYALSIFTLITATLLTIITGAIIIVSWVLIYMAILRLAKYVDLGKASK
ncbi:hypothetical protein [Vulcanisaeta sp. JCM 16159]|uniref:hypothetical protein n=1 Tax=Vulcanisaeta sp. JCM 16159 TaxID=1295371 RepID=UPI0006D077C4|nr:hypothetical protein [Vulcanisaeta sp. JCM 16159]